MKIAEFLERNELSGKALATALGYSSSDSVNGRVRRDEDIPEAWLPKIAELGYSVDGTMAQVDDAEMFRVQDGAPTAPEGAVQAVPVRIDYASVAGYIEGAYKLSAQFAVATYDPLLAEVLTEHAAQAGQAWAHWIESEPKVAALLQRLMIGTPLGEVVGVHVAIVFSYTLARAAARELAGAAASHGQDVSADGGAAEAASDYVA